MRRCFISNKHVIFLFYGFGLLWSCTPFTPPEGSSSGLNLPDCANDNRGACVLVQRQKTALELSLQPENIAAGAQIFGIVGTSLGPSSGFDALMSTMNKSPLVAQRSVLDETVTAAGQFYPNDVAGFRAVPNLISDNDGTVGAVFTGVDRAGWGSRSCGLTQPSVEDRVKDCFTQLGAETTWDGLTKGTPGAGRWKLVSRSGDVDPVSRRGREVWRDERTGLLWSSLLSGGADGKSLNWCKAAGSHNIAGTIAAENDPNDYCDQPAHQNTTGTVVSACFEAPGFSDVDPDIDPNGKVALGLGSTPSVAWRIPTLYDYIRADIDGIRFVMTETRTNFINAEFSATINSANRAYAWTYNGYGGDTSRRYRDQRFTVRCVGR